MHEKKKVEIKREEERGSERKSDSEGGKGREKNRLSAKRSIKIEEEGEMKRKMQR